MDFKKLSKQEAEQIIGFLVNQAVEKLGITPKQARLRVEAIGESGILGKFGTPEQESFQIAIDAAMMIPQREY